MNNTEEDKNTISSENSEDTITFKFHPSYFSSRSSYYNSLNSSKEVQDQLLPKNPPIQIKNIHGTKLLGISSELKKDLKISSEESTENGRESPTLVFIPPLPTEEDKSSFDTIQKLFYLAIVIDIAICFYSFLQRLAVTPTTKIPNFILLGFNLFFNFVACLSVQNQKSNLITCSLGIYSLLFFINLVIIES